MKTYHFKLAFNWMYRLWYNSLRIISVIYYGNSLVISYHRMYRTPNDITLLYVILKESLYSQQSATKKEEIH